jgi:thymidylate synthase (FAD)
MIEILDGTTKNPLQKIGYNAGVCWGAPLDDTEKNKKRAISCIKAGHGRVMEFVEVEVVVSGISARCAREIYTHIAGVTRLQASTRYISEEAGFDYYTPTKIAAQPETEMPYTLGMQQIQDSYNTLLERGIAKEDAANLLPLGMNTKMVWKINLRSLVNFMNKRLCTRALKEIREFAIDLKNKLAEIDDEWAWIANALFVPQCEIYKYRNENLVFCTEQQCCGKHKKIEDIEL